MSASLVGVVSARDLPEDWHRSVDWLWHQDDACPSEDTPDRAWRRLFGSDLPRGGRWGQAEGPWIAARDEGDACTYVDDLGRVWLSSYPGATAVGVLCRSPASDLPRVVISGGQTGADRGALDAAREVGVPRAGWVPRGWRAEDGQVPESYRSDLREHESSDYMARTRANVDDCDGVILVSSSGELSTGTLRTRQYADRVGKPVLHVVSSGDADWSDRIVAEVATWIRDRRVGVLMVAGPRESRDAGIAEATRRLIAGVLARTRRWSAGGPAARCRVCGDVMTEEGCEECAGREEQEAEGGDHLGLLAVVARPTIESLPSSSVALRYPRWDLDQEAAILVARRWMTSPIASRQVMCLFGYAGTGKTTIARHLVAESGQPWLFAAYTGKAALVMRQRGCTGASTIHSLIYRPNQESSDDERERELSFRLVGDSPLRDAAGVVVDECSMVDQQVGEDLLSFGKKVLVLGDPAQLPPISGGGFFTSREPDVLLSRVHRQARESGILDLATHVREGGELADRIGWQTADCEVVARGSLPAQEIMARMVDADQVIVGLNRTRRKINGMYRRASGAVAALPVVGDKLVCLRNQRRSGLFNGSLWRVDGASPSSDGRTVQLDLASLDGDVGAGQVSVRSWAHHFLDRSDELEAMGPVRMAYQEFDFAYALTCHKAQGSQWDSVVLYDESGAFREHRRRWLYTGITRAARRLLVIA